MLQDQEKDAFKRWLVPQLDKISDANADILADYVIALLAVETSEESARRNCVAALSDILNDYTEWIVDEVLKAVSDRRYTNSPPASIASTKHTASPVVLPKSLYDPLAAPSSIKVPASPPDGHSVSRNRPVDRPDGHHIAHNWQKEGGKSSRKRKLSDRDTSQSGDSQDLQHGRAAVGHQSSRQAIQRPGQKHRPGAGPMEGDNGFFVLGSDSNRVPAPPTNAWTPSIQPGLPYFDPSDPISFIAMATALGIGYPISQLGNGIVNGPKYHEECKTYEMQGFCALGSACLYKHGRAILIPADEVWAYVTNQSSQTLEFGGSSSGRRQHKRSRTYRDSRKKGIPTGGHTHSPLLESPADPSDRKIVVEQIPQHNFREEDVRAFFSQFGKIEGLTMQASRRLAIIEFENPSSASRAFSSPKVVFNNRFVQVHRYKPPFEHSISEISALPEEFIAIKEEEEEEAMNPEAMENCQAEYQKAFEERKKKVEDVTAKFEEITQQIRENFEGIRTLKRDLAVKEGRSLEELDLEYLMVDAHVLFADQASDAGSVRSFGRGGFRRPVNGRTYNSPHGRGFASISRSSYAGKVHRGIPFNGKYCSVKRWDNRPKRIAIAGVEAGSKKDKLLRQVLFTCEGCTNTDQHTEKSDTLIATFQERYMAEMFLDKVADLPNVDELELSWVPNDVSVI